MTIMIFPTISKHYASKTVFLSVNEGKIEKTKQKKTPSVVNTKMHNQLGLWDRHCTDKPARL